MFIAQNKILRSNTYFIRCWICVILLLVGFLSNGQKSTITNIELDTASNTINYKIPGKRFFAIYVPSGSEFFDNEWKPGYLILENGDKYDNLHLKYNTLKDELITLNNRTSTLIMIDKDAVSEFGLYYDNHQTLRFKKYSFNKGAKESLYFNVLYEGQIKLLVWQRTIEEKTSPYKDRNGYLQVSQYNLRPQNYTLFPDGSFERFRFKRRSFLSLFDDTKKEIRRLLRKNKIHLRDQSDYIQAIQLIESEYYIK